VKEKLKIWHLEVRNKYTNGDWEPTGAEWAYDPSHLQREYAEYLSSSDTLEYRLACYERLPQPKGAK